MKKILCLNAVVLFICFQAVTYVSALVTCPVSSDVSPCCYEDGDNMDNGDVTLVCSSPRATLGLIKNALVALKDRENIKVEVKYTKLGTIPSDFFKGSNMKSLEIYQCWLDSLSEGGGLESTLEELTIYYTFNEEDELAKLPISNLSHLTDLHLSYNRITELEDDWFRNAPKSLRRIIISKNGINRIGRKAFAGVTNLEFISLDGNTFGPVSRSMFPTPAKELNVLGLDNNTLTSLPDDIFTQMPNLKVISLVNNGIEFLPEKTWKDVWNSLVRIDLRGNPLRCDSHMDWMSQIPTCADIYASCASPREKYGQRVPILRHENCGNKHVNSN